MPEVKAIGDEIRTLTLVNAVSESRAMFLENAAIHHHGEACILGLLCGSRMDYAFLQPNRWHLQANGLINDLRHEFWAAKDIDHIDLLRNVGE